MSTSEKLTYLNTTKQKLKQAINNLGGDITSETTFRNYVEELEEIYDNLPKTDYAEGSNITLSNTLKGKLDYENEIVGYGDVSQDSATGSNLMNTEKIVNGTYNGLTITKDSDDFINISGTATANTSIVLSEITYNFPSTLYISYENTFTTNTAQLSFLNGSTTLGGLTFSGANRTYDMSTILGGKTCTKIELYITSGNTINGKFRPMLNTQSGQTYSKYAFPNPSYPSPVNVVRGKNRFDISQVEIGKAWNNASSTARAVCYMECKPNTIYTISINNSVSQFDSGVVRVFEKTSKDVNTMLHQWELSETYAPTRTITTDSTTNVLCVQFNKDNISLSDLENVKIQIEKGSQATSYLPYNTLEVKARGKNLADNSKLVNGYMTAEGIWHYGSGNEYRSTDLIEVKKGKTYTSSLYNKNKEKIAYLVWTTYDINKNFIAQYTTSNIVISSGVKYIRARNYQAQTSYIDNDDYLYQVEENNTPTNYEPYYTPQIKQLSLGDKELAKISTYVDTFEYDIDNDKVYKDKAINKKTFIGASDEMWELDINFQRAYNTDISSLVLRPSLSTEKFNGISDKLIIETFENVYANKKQGLACSTGGAISVHIDNVTDTLTNVSQFKTWLASNPLTLYYVLNEAVKEEITGTLKDQIKDLYYTMSYTGTTILEVDGDLPLIIKTRALKGE